MIDPRQKIERFCYRHPNFGIPNLMRYLTIANVVFWVMNMINRPFLSYMLFNPALIQRGQVWRLVSFLFVPPSTGVLALLVFYFYYWIGSTLEKQWGTGQFTIYFFTGVVLTVLYGFLIYWITGKAVTLDSSYLYLSMFFSFAALFPDMQVLFMFFIPVKMKYLAIVDAAFFLYAMVTTPFPANLVPLVAVLNFLIFCGESCAPCCRAVPERPRSTSKKNPPVSGASRRTSSIPTSAPSAAGRIRTTLSWSFATAPAARAITASAATTSTTISTSPSDGRTGNRRRPRGRAAFF